MISEPKRDMQKAETIILLLSKLAVHYYQADFTELMAKSRIRDMVGDLIEFAIPDVEKAIEGYRRMPFPPGKFKPFPDSGTLRKLASDERKHREDLAKSPPISPQFRESRPIMWWAKPKAHWRESWKEGEVPAGQLIRDDLGTKLRQPVRP